MVAKNQVCIVAIIIVIVSIITVPPGGINIFVFHLLAN